MIVTKRDELDFGLCISNETFNQVKILHVQSESWLSQKDDFLGQFSHSKLSFQVWHVIFIKS